MKSKKHNMPTSHEDEELNREKTEELKREREMTEEIDFIKYLPKKTYTSSPSIDMQPATKKPK
jgi:hypothetical protein